MSKRVKVPFRFKLIALFLIMMFISAVVLVFAYFGLKKYEATNPTGILNSYVSYIKQEKYKDAMKISGVEEEKFFTINDYSRYIKDLLGAVSKATTVEVYSKDTNKRQFKLYGDNIKNYVLLTLSPDANGVYKLVQEEIKKEKYIITAPSDFVIDVNGIKLTADDTTKKDAVVEGYEGLPDQSLVPKMTEYTVEGYIKNPEIKVDGKNDSDITITVDKNNISIGYTVKESDEFKNLTEDAAKAYAKFISKDDSLTNLRKRLVKDTTFDKDLSNYSNYWYIEHDKISFDDLKYENIAMYSENTFSAEISFNYVVTKGRLVNNYPVKYRIYFLKEGTTYKVVNIKSL